jgi:hypothetical protein
MDQLPLEQVNVAALRQLLTEHFDKSELRNLCFDLGIDYEGLPAQEKAGKVRELVAYARRHQRTDDLLAQVRRLRPEVDWQQVNQITPKEDVQQLATRYLIACEKAASAAQPVNDRRHPELEGKNMSTDLKIGRYTEQERFSVIFVSDYYQHAFSSIQARVDKWYIGVYHPQSSDETAILRDLPNLLERPGERSRELNEGTPQWIRDELQAPLVVGLLYSQSY